jgi:probable HAF family extracellular repeat protein
MIGSRKALLLDCFPEHDMMGQVQTVRLGLAGCSRPEFAIDYFGADDCSIERFKAMRDYGLIVISSHGGITRKINHSTGMIDTWVSVTTRTEATPPIVEEYSLALRSKELEVSYIGSMIRFGPTYEYLGIRQGFVASHCYNMPDSIVYVSACSSLKKPQLGAAFLAAGAGAYYGYDEDISFGWASSTGVSLIRDLIDGEDSLEALVPIRGTLLNWFDTLIKDKAPRTVTLSMMGGGLDGTHPVAFAAPRYEITDLGHLSSSPGTSEALDINRDGAVVGYSHYDGHDHPTAVRAFLWESPTTGMIELSTPVDRHSKANSINNSNQIAGEIDYTPIGSWLEFSHLWEDDLPVALSTEMADLDPPPEGSAFNVIRNRARSVGDMGHIVGEAFFHGSELPEHPSVSGTWGYLYDRNSVVNLFTVPEYAGLDQAFSDARDVNCAGVVVGSTGYRLDSATTRSTAFKWRNGEMKLLFTPEGTSSYARAINIQPEVVGYLLGDATDDKRLPAHWSINGSLTQLSLLRDYESGIAIDIGDSGLIVGYSTDEGVILGDVTHAMLWEALDEPPLDLNWLIPGDSGMVLIRANAINDHGQIVGMGSLAPGGYRAFLLTPIDD